MYLARRQRLLCALIVLVIIVALYAAMCLLTGVDPGAYPYDSYYLQAQAWARGDLALDQNYEYLELATYNGKYYVSFPPVPTIPMLLWVWIFGNEVTPPGGLFQKIYAAIACFIVLAALLRRKRAKAGDCVAWAIFICFSSALLPITLVGGVWYEAQILSFLFCIAAVAAIRRNHPTISCLCYALSVGCRPFTVCLGPVLLAMYLRQGRRRSEGGLLLHLMPGLFIGLSIAAAYATFNLIRFGNPFEFGHNYLPEFLEAEHGQFSFHYIAQNWRTLLFGSPFYLEDGNVLMEKFGSSIFLSCPILICNLVWAILDIVKRRFSWTKFVILLMGALNILLLLMHRTVGGYQFGLRYAIELIPLSFAYLLLSPNRKRISRWETALLAFGLIYNFAGGCLLHV